MGGQINCMRPFSILHQAVASPVFADEQKTRLASLLNQITLGLAALSIFYVIISTILSYTPLNLIFGFLVFGLCLLMNRAARKGYTRAASLGLAASLWLTFSLAALSGESAGVFDASFTGYIIPIILAGYLISGRAGLAFALQFRHEEINQPPASRITV